MNGTKKKVIIPAVALMLCACAVAGVAYAANTTTVTNSGNSIGMDVVSLTLKEGDSYAGAATFDNAKVSAYSTQNYDTVTWQYASDNVLELTKNHKLKLDATSDGSSLTTSQTVSVALTGTLAGNAISSFTVYLGSDSSTSNKVTFAVTNNVIGSATGTLTVTPGTAYDLHIVIGLNEASAINGTPSATGLQFVFSSTVANS